jgi:hypothetical protein
MPELKLGLNDKALFEAQAGKAGGAGGGTSGKKSVDLEVRAVAGRARARRWREGRGLASKEEGGLAARARHPARARTRNPAHRPFPPSHAPQDIKFHQCVRLTRFESDRTISFIPPDGEFELMSYRLNTSLKPLITLETSITAHGRSRVDYAVKAKSTFKNRSYANNVDILIPVPPDVDSPAFSASVGTVTYVPDLECIKWSIRQLPGGKDVAMNATFGLPSVAGEEVETAKWRKRTAQVKFEIPYFSVSGIQVRYLKILEKSGYEALPWV